MREESSCWAMCAGDAFDADVVGPDGRGYAWQAHDAADAAGAAARFSLAPPPPLPPLPGDDFPDDDSAAAAGEDAAEAAPVDPEVRPLLHACFCIFQMHPAHCHPYLVFVGAHRPSCNPLHGRSVPCQI